MPKFWEQMKGSSYHKDKDEERQAEKIEPSKQEQPKRKGWLVQQVEKASSSASRVLVGQGKTPEEKESARQAYESGKKKGLYKAEYRKGQKEGYAIGSGRHGGLLGALEGGFSSAGKHGKKGDFVDNMTQVFSGGLSSSAFGFDRPRKKPKHKGTVVHVHMDSGKQAQNKPKRREPEWWEM
jgi:hypothetical protein